MMDAHKQFREIPESDFSQKEKDYVSIFRKIYTNNLEVGVAEHYINKFWLDFAKEQDRISDSTKTSTGINREKLEHEYLDLLFRTARVLVSSGYAVDAIDFLEEKKGALSELFANKSYVPVMNSEDIITRLKNAIESYKEEVLPQLIRDVDFDNIKMGGPTKEFGKTVIFKKK